MKPLFIKNLILVSLIIINVHLYAQETGVVTEDEITDLTYIIHAEDELSIEYTYIQDNLEPAIQKDIYIVSKDGYITHEIAGDIKAQGLTLSELQLVLTQRLSKFIINPRARVHIIRRSERWIFLYGEIQGYGHLPLKRKMTVGELLISKGGPNENADPTRILIRRKDGKIFNFNFNSYLFEGDETNNVVLADGDLIIVPRKIPQVERITRYSKDFVLQPGNELEISVNETERIDIAPEPPERYTIDREGNIYHRLFGLVRIAGLTITEAEQQMTEVAKNYFAMPVVSIRVVQIVSKSVLVFGKTAKTGIFPLPRNMKLSDFLATLGGFYPEADLTKIVVSRENGDILYFDLEAYLLKHDNTNNVYLENGDKIVIREKPKRMAEKAADFLQPYGAIFGALNTIVLVLFATGIIRIQ